MKTFGSLQLLTVYYRTNSEDLIRSQIDIFFFWLQSSPLLSKINNNLYMHNIQHIFLKFSLILFNLDRKIPSKVISIYNTLLQRSFT